MNFDPTVSLGSLLHAAIMVATIAVCYFRIKTDMRRIEGKQDSLLAAMSKTDE